MLYYFILGQNPTLSAVEIYYFLKKEKFDFKIEKISDEVLLVDFKKEIEAEKIIDSLGGTIKIGQVITQTTKGQITPECIINNFPPARRGIKGGGSKFHFGFSTYTLKPNKFRLSKNFGLEVKKLLKEKNISSRFVTSRESNLSSVVVAKNRLLKNGAEICFLVDQDKIYLGKTLTVQKFGEYSKLDYGRPGRDIRSGMLPPKVAKMMVNLTQIPNNKYQIIDPFCGSGTILQQAALLGYQNLIGSDISDKAINNTKRNFNYLNVRAIHELPQQLPPTLHVLDATKLSSKIKPNSIDAIITEPYLGPPLKGNESREKIQEIISQLAELYLKAFAEFKKVLKSKGKVVIIFPLLKGEKSMINNDLEKIKKLGFSYGLDLPPEFNSLKITPRQSIIYSRPGQRVEREIFIFVKNNH